VKKLVALVVAALVLSGCGGLSKKTQTDRLPDVSLASLTGGAPVDLGTLHGPAVVNLWAQWCVPCRRELPIYQAFYAKHGAKVPVLGVDWQETREDWARKLARQSGVTYPLVADPDPKILNRALPTLVLIDAHGKIAFQEYVEIKSLAQLEKLVEDHLGVTL
jgi:cytochrome c biogenesis protein CcmG, thiol:disulfide interchange protein DsbE